VHPPRRLIASTVLALALTACGGAPEELSNPEGQPNPDALSEPRQSLVSGYGIRVYSGTYTVAGLVMPRWTAPAGHSPGDYITIAEVGSAPTSYISWQYATSATSGIADLVTITTTAPTTSRYEARYFLADGTLAAVSSSFPIQAAPVINRGTRITGGLVPTAHVVVLNKTSGNLVVNWDMYGASGPVAFSNALGRVLVRTAPDSYNNSASNWEWTLPCP